MNARIFALTVIVGSVAVSSLMGCASQLPATAQQPGAHALVDFAIEAPSRREPPVERFARAEHPAEHGPSGRRNGR